MIALLFALLVPLAQAKVLLSTDEALALAFPGCQVTAHTAYLSTEQRAAASELAGAKVESGMIRQHIGSCDGTMAGTAYFETHRVRTLPETLMVVITPAGDIGRIEILSFSEPSDYLPPAPFYGQFSGKSLGNNLSFKHGLRRISGATLSSNATLQAARRVLAVHQIIQAGS